MILRIIKLIAIAFSAALVSCYYDKEELLYGGGIDCSGVDARFSANVNPLIQTRCAISGCHNNASTNSGGPLTSHAQIQGKAAQIKIQVGTRLMPMGSSLTDAEIRTIICWIDSGAQNN